MSRMWVSCGVALVLVAAVAVPVRAQCEDCPMHKKGEEAAADAGYRMLVGVTGADSEQARIAIARGVEFVLDLPAESLTFGEDGKLALPIGAKRIVKVSELAAILDKISAAVQKQIPGARFGLDEAGVAFTGPVRLHMKGLRCEGCVAKLTKTFSAIDSAVRVRRQDDGTGMVGMTVSDLPLAELKKPLEGTHFEIADAEMGSPGCPHPDCDPLDCPHKGAADGQGEGVCPHKGAAEGECPDKGEGECPHKGAAEGECPHKGAAEGEGECPHKGAAEGECPHKGAAEGEGECPHKGAAEGGDAEKKPGCCKRGTQQQ
ncbi:MAG: hypothetical protein HY720_31360 [Planctomycetes bacterium]|nr:hypothetical protein [Planctomycetota bacterium]